MFPNPFFAAMGGPFGAGLNNMGMAGQGMPGFMGNQAGGMAGSGMQAGHGLQVGQGMQGGLGMQPMQSMGPGPNGPMKSANDAQGAGGSHGVGGGGGGGRHDIDNIRSRVCMKFLHSGSCNYGDACKYAHVRDLSQLGMASGGGGGGGAGGGQQQGERGRRGARGGDRGGGGGGGGGGAGGPGSSGMADDEQGGRGKNQGARKTRLCEKFMATGQCPYGDKCTFAHGMDELRQHTSRDAQQQQQQPESLPPPPPVPGPAPPSEPFPGAPRGQGAGAPQQVAATGKPPAAAAAAAGGKPDGAGAGQQPAGGAGKQQQQPEVTFVDKVRALCGVLSIGNAAALGGDKPLALQTAAMSLRNGNAFKENPFADSVERYIQLQ